MSSESEQELRRLTDSIKEVEGVLYIAVYGSYARGDYDRGSDIDILILFEDKRSLRANKRDVVTRAGRFQMFFQLTMFSLKEFFENCNPVFVRSVVRDGRMLFQRESKKMERHLKRFTQKHPELVLKES